ncbi:MAG: DUF4363 family protein [Angelakisella sp.]
MKRLVIAIVLLIGIVSIAGVSLWDLGQGLDELNTAVDDLRRTPPSEENRLTEKSARLLELWNKKEKRFVLYINHGTLDHITQIVAELPSLAQYGEYSHLYSKADAISALLEDLWQSSLPTYRTLL